MKGVGEWGFAALVETQGRSALGDLNREDGDVVFLFLGSTPPCDLFNEASNTFLERVGASSADRFEEPKIAELLAGGVHRLGNPI